MERALQEIKNNTRAYLFGALFVGLLSGAYFGVPVILPVSYSSPEVADSAAVASVEEERKESISHASHIPTPEAVKAIYMSQCVVGTPSFRDSLITLIEETELNSVVIDIKDYTGKIAFETEHPLLKSFVSDECGARDMRGFIETLHEKEIYVIGRITVFQDPFYAEIHPELAVQSVSGSGTPWVDYKGLSFIDVSSKPFWEYIVALSKESYEIGFDELNYDYIRYPSDGPMKDAKFVNDNKSEALEIFFKYLYEEVHPIGVKMSADLFGYTAIFTNDLGIGQQLERALPYFDYIAPMVYPSHYNKGFAGLENPNTDPYKVVFTSMEEAVRRTLAKETVVETLDGEEVFTSEVIPAHYAEDVGFVATSTRQVVTGYYTKPVYDIQKLRPWLQDFDYGGDYDIEEVRAQIQATYDTSLTSWMLWSPSNRYTRGALEPAQE
ncbi:MAG: putative glycoside hydrolase [Candidatus Pacebacteria bacterium]|nr:putative glycoside hydrolase [Candidatus Paceibacterota bacterium]